MIKLKEELKSIRNNKLSKIKKIAKKMRHELEKYHDWKNNKSCFSGKCHNISQTLVNELKKEGIYSYRQMGEYAGANESYTPNMSDWKQWEKDEYSEMRASDGESMTYSHWWVVADNKFILDITADQFHPDSPNDYRIVITTIDDEHYV